MKQGQRVLVMPVASEGRVSLQGAHGRIGARLLDAQPEFCAGHMLHVEIELAQQHRLARVQLRLSSQHSFPTSEGDLRQGWLAEITAIVACTQRPPACVGVGGGVEVLIGERRGQLEVRHSGKRYLAWLMRVPDNLYIGQALHLRLVLNASDSMPVAGESVDVMGRVLRVDGDGRMPIRRGGRFELGIEKHLGHRFPLPVLGSEQVDRMLRAWAQHHRASLRRATPPPIPQQLEAAEARLDDSGLSGQIEQMSFIELLQSLSMNRKTARLELFDGARKALAYLHEGQLVALFDDDLAGEQAFFALAAWRRGVFRVYFGGSTPSVNVHHSLTYLVLEYMRRVDENEIEQIVLRDAEFEVGVDEAISVRDLRIIDIEESEAPSVSELSTPVEPLRPLRSRPQVSFVEGARIFGAYFDDPPAQPVQDFDDQEVSFSAPRALRPEVEGLLNTDDNHHSLFGGWSSSNSTPPSA